ncbi:MAG: 50S ribosomal protein L10 [Acidimicrobiia bacterium]|nr:50S ribosomal protein L10 [Acidimicrobiia bacterium]
MAGAQGATEIRSRKVAVVDEIRTKLAEADAAVLTEYRGLTVSELADLRRSLRPAGTEYKIFKNTLARRAIEGSGRSELLPLLEGPVAIAFVRGDAVVAAKALREFGRANPALVVKGGLLGERFLSPAEVDALAQVEPREVLLARMAGGFQAPLVRAAGLFQAITRNMAYGLKAYLDLRVEGGEALPAGEPAGEGAAVPAAAGAAEEPAADESAEPDVPVAGAEAGEPSTGESPGPDEPAAGGDD